MHIIAALYLAFQAVAASPDTAHVVIVATTDVHGRALDWDYVRDAASPGGLSRAATALETLRARYPGSLVLVDAGDLLQGNPFAAFYARDDKRQPQPIVDALNALQYDAVTPGNHDFDFGLDFLRRAAGDATYHYVSANVVSDSGKTLFAPTVMLARGPIKIGITGLTTPGTNLWDRAQLGRYHVRRIAEAAPGAVAALAGADLKIVLIHSGFGESSYDTTGVGPENDAQAVATASPKPDLVIVGHTHREIRDTVANGVHFVQPKNWARSSAVVDVTLTKAAATGRPRERRASRRDRVSQARPRHRRTHAPRNPRHRRERRALRAAEELGAQHRRRPRDAHEGRRDRSLSRDGDPFRPDPADDHARAPALHPPARRGATSGTTVGGNDARHCRCGLRRASRARPGFAAARLHQ